MSKKTTIKGISYTEAMVLAKIAGLKIQTRRLKGLHELNTSLWYAKTTGEPIIDLKSHINRALHVYGRPMDLVYGRESYADDNGRTLYMADPAHREVIRQKGLKVMGAMYMPVHRSRIFDVIVRTSVQPLRSMTVDDAVLEGVSSVQEYADLFDSIYSKPKPVLKGSALHSYSFYGEYGTAFIKGRAVRLIPNPYVLCIHTIPASDERIRQALGYNPKTVNT